MSYLRIFIFFSSLILGSCTGELKENAKLNLEVKDSSSVIEKIYFFTDDSIKIAANYYYRFDKKDVKQPLAVLVHQYKSDKYQWHPHFIDSLILHNFKIISYDIRNHGESQKSDVQLYELLSNNLPVRDISAVFHWTKSVQGIDTERIAVVGTSMGASLAVYSGFFLGAKVIIGVSGGKGTFEAYTGFDERMMSMKPIPRIDNVLFICGENDNNYAEEERIILENFVMQPFELMLYPSSAHGKKLIEEYPEIYSLIIKWITKLI